MDETATSHQLFQLSLSPLIYFPLLLLLLLHLDRQISEHRLSFSAHIKELWKFLFFLCFFYRFLWFTYIHLEHDRLDSRISRSINRLHHPLRRGYLSHAFLFTVTRLELITQDLQGQGLVDHSIINYCTFVT